MKRPEYMKVAYKHFPPDIKEMYKLEQLVTSDGYIYVKIKKVCTAWNKPPFLHTNDLKQHYNGLDIIQ